MLYEIFAREAPYKDLSAIQASIQVATKGNGLVINAKWPEPIRQVMASCLQTDAKLRPVMVAVYNQLNAYLETLNGSGSATAGSGGSGGSGGAAAGGGATPSSSLSSLSSPPTSDATIPLVPGGPTGSGASLIGSGARVEYGLYSGVQFGAAGLEPPPPPSAPVAGASVSVTAPPAAGVNPATK